MDGSLYGNLASRQIQLDKLKVGVLVTSRELLNRYGEWTAEDLIEQGLIQIKQTVLKERFQTGKEIIEFEWTEFATWWDAFKAAKFPRWLLRRFPAQRVRKTAQKKLNFARYAVYPSLPCLPQFERASNFGIIVTTQEIPRTLDVDLGGMAQLEIIMSSISGGLDRSRGEFGEEVKFMVCCESTWLELLHALRSFNALPVDYNRSRFSESVPLESTGVATAVEPKLFGVPVRHNRHVPPGILRLIHWGTPRTAFIAD